MNGEIERQSAHKQLFDDKLGWDRGTDGWRRPEREDGRAVLRCERGTAASHFTQYSHV